MTTTIDRGALQRVIAVINGKGGVLKTTLTSNIGGLLANSGYRVLLVDLDPQGNLAEDLGYTGDDRDDQGNALMLGLMGSTSEPIKSIRPNLDVYAGGPRLDRASAALVAQAAADPVGAQLALAKLLEPIASDYDMILLDCPPGDQTLQTAAVAAARWALVPVKSDKSSRRGMEAVASRVASVVENGVNPGIDLLGIVVVDITLTRRPTGSTATRVEAAVRKEIVDVFKEESLVFSATVRHSETTAQATRERGLLVHELDEAVVAGPAWYDVLKGEAVAQSFAPRSATSVADDLQAVVEEVVARIGAAESEAAATAPAGRRRA
jgi:chromosome partitioning protein